MEYEIKRFNIWSVAKITFIVFLVIGILLSLFYLSIISLIQNFIHNFGGGEFDNDIMFITGITGIILPIFISIFYAVMATIFSVFVLGLYNIAASIIGGIKFTINKKESDTSEEKIYIEKTSEE